MICVDTRRLALVIATVACGTDDPDWVLHSDAADLDAQFGVLVGESAHTIDDATMVLHRGHAIGVVQCRCGNRSSIVVHAPAAEPHELARPLELLRHAALSLPCPQVGRPGAPADTRCAVHSLG